MIERGKVNLYYDAITCPNCGSPLTYVDGIRKCTACDYQLAVNEINYTQRIGNICMICCCPLTQNELQICQKCKAKIKSTWGENKK